MMTPKEMRAATGMSQGRFAEFVKIRPGTLRDWEQGRKKPDESRLFLMEYMLRNEGLLKDTEETENVDLTVVSTDTPEFLEGLQNHLQKQMWRAELEYRARHLPEGSNVEWLAPYCQSVEDIKWLLRDLGMRVGEVVDEETTAGEPCRWVVSTSGIVIHVNQPEFGTMGFVTGRMKPKRRK